MVRPLDGAYVAHVVIRILGLAFVALGPRRGLVLGEREVVGVELGMKIKQSCNVPVESLSYIDDTIIWL